MQYKCSKSSLHGSCYKLNTVNDSLIICDSFLNMNNTHHLIMAQAFYGTDP